MRILVITNMYPPHHYGGYELQCQDTVDRWRRRGHTVEVLTTTVEVPGVEAPQGEQAQGIRRDLELYWADHEVLQPSLRRRLRIERTNQAALRRVLDELEPDVVSVWAMSTMSLGLLTTIAEQDIPTVFVTCNFWLEYSWWADSWSNMFLRRGRLGRLVGRWARPLFGVPTIPPDVGRMGVFLCVSDAVRASAESAASYWPARQTSVVYSGIDETDFPLLEPQIERGPWAWRLLCVGRIDREKGLETAIRALARLPHQSTLEILGRGDESFLQELRELIDELNLHRRVTFTTVARAQLAAHYRAADAFVFPVTWDEPFGLTPLEAMACGTPVVGTATGGSGEYLLDGVNCLRYPAGDDEALANALIRLAEDPAVVQQLVKGGHRTAKELTITKLVDILEEWHSAAAERFRDGRPRDRRPISDVLTEPESTEPIG